MVVIEIFFGACHCPTLQRKELLTVVRSLLFRMILPRMNNTSPGPNFRLWLWRCRPQPTAMLTSTSTPTKQFLFRWGQNKQSCARFFLMGGTSAVVLNIVNCRALFVLPQIWMSQKTLCLQHFFLKGWDEAREIHAYPPGEYNSASFWIIFMKQQHLILDHFHDNCPDEDSIHHHHNPHHGQNFLS